MSNDSISSKKKKSDFNNFRDLLRILEEKLVDTIFNDTNKKIKTILGNFFDSNFLDTSTNRKSVNCISVGKNIIITLKTKLLQTSFARKFTETLKFEGFQYYTAKNPKKIRFNETIRNFIKEKKIQFTYFPLNYKFSENLKKDLYVFSDKPKKGALLHNYKTLILHF